MKRSYTLKSIEALMSEYASHGGQVYELVPGTLGYGLTVCTLSGYKSCVIREYPTSIWGCTHTVRFYNNLPRKYVDMIAAYEERTEAEAV